MATYYVKNGGNDSLSGLDDDNAWETLTKCSSKGSNNTFLLKCGSVWIGESLNLAGKSNLIVTSYDTGNKPLIDGNNAIDNGVYFYGNSIEISNIDTKNCNIHGIYFGTISVPHTDFTIHNCSASYNASSGIRINGSNCTIYNNECFNNGTGDSPGIQIYGSNNHIYNNNSHDNLGSGYEINTNSLNNIFELNFGDNNQDQFLEVWDNSHFNIIRKNYGNGYAGVGIKLTKGSSDNLVYNNILVSSSGLDGFGISLGYSGESVFCFRNKIYNNLIIETGTSGDAYGLNVRAVGHKNNIFKNNICLMNSSPAIRCLDSDNTFDNNCYYLASGNMIIWLTHNYTMAQFATYQSTEGQDAHSIATDPFLKTNYKLNSTSPCINAGATLVEVTDDYEGNPRPMGGAYDIGAYEYYKAKIKNATLKNCTV